MARVWTAVLIVASFLLVAPVIESATFSTGQLFVAVGNADDGGGGE